MHEGDFRINRTSGSSYARQLPKHNSLKWCIFIETKQCRAIKYEEFMRAREVIETLSVSGTQLGAKTKIHLEVP